MNLSLVFAACDIKNSNDIRIDWFLIAIVPGNIGVNRD
jgi:hypothetical protein